MSHPQALNEEQILQLMANSIPAIARRLEQDEGWAFLMKQANRVKELEAENARLKAEVERLTSDIQMEKENEDRLVREWQRANNEVYGLQRQVAALIDNQTRLKAEVERLQSIHSIDSIGIEQLKAQVERLTKAGDNLEQVLTEISYSYRAGNASHEWRAAKEGKQP
jgi:chromosome segregation ATPase